MTPVGWLNILVLQWFGVRLIHAGNWRRPVGLLFGVIPLTGWRGPYRGRLYMWRWG